MVFDHFFWSIWSVSRIYFRQNTTTKTVKVLGLQPGTVDSPWIHLFFGSWWLGNRRPHEDGRGRIFQMATDDLATGEIHGFRWWNPSCFQQFSWNPPWISLVKSMFFSMLVMLVMLISHKVSTYPMENHHSYWWRSAAQVPINPLVYHHFSYKLCINWGWIHLLEEIINKNRVAEAKTWYDSMTLP